MATDWLKLQTEYLQSDLSLRALARLRGVSPTALGRVAAREGSAALKRAQRLLDAAQAATPGAPPQPCGEPAAVDAAGYGKAERMARLIAIGDQLTDQLARATVELDKQVLRHKRKTREVVYDGPEARGKPVEETVEENYHLEIVDAPVNCAGLQKLSATLKNLRDAARATDGEAQGVGMVAELMRKLDDDAREEG